MIYIKKEEDVAVAYCDVGTLLSMCLFVVCPHSFSSKLRLLCFKFISLSLCFSDSVDFIFYILFLEFFIFKVIMPFFSKKLGSTG